MEWSAFEQYDGLTDMTAGKRNLCESAREYYFSLLFPADGDPVPENIRRHVESCPCCGERLSQMKALLAGLVQFGADKQYYIRQLVRHFSLVKTEVDCEQVKKLLPLLADGKFNVPVPTPVTVHVDQCPQCVHDLQTLRSLCLSSRQLARLGDFFAAESFDGSKGCEKIEQFVADVARMHLERVERAVLDHICLCRKCRRLLYDERLRLKGEMSGQTEIIPLPCGSIEQIDVYDYVVPFGLEEATDKYVRNREALAEHLRQCPSCLEKMRQLHNIVYTIDNRANSGVTTWYELSPAEVKHGFEDASAEYADFPLNIQVSKRTIPQPVPIIAAKPAPTPAPKPRKKRQLANYIRPIGIAATIMLIGSFLFFTSQSQAVALAQIYEAVGNAVNVCASIMRPGESEPVQTTWASQRHGLLLRKMRGSFTLWNVESGTTKSNFSSPGTVRTTQLSKDMVQRARESIAEYMQVVPFSDERKIPTGWQWKKVEEAELESALPGTVVYDLTWNERGASYRWRGFIDALTNLPKRTELYEKREANQSFVLKAIRCFEYLGDAEMFAAIEACAVE